MRRNEQTRAKPRAAVAKHALDGSYAVLHRESKRDDAKTRSAEASQQLSKAAVAAASYEARVHSKHTCIFCR